MSVSHSDFRALMRKVFEECLALQDRKGRDYSGDGNALRAFQSQGERLKITPLQSWGVLADKGWNAMITTAGTGETGSEPLIERVKDAINYSVFFLALAMEAGLETGHETELDIGPDQSESDDDPTGLDPGVPSTRQVMRSTSKPKYPHKYADHDGTSDCEYGCGCWMGPFRSGGPKGIDQWGNCPGHPEYPATGIDGAQRPAPLSLQERINALTCPQCGGLPPGEASGAVDICTCSDEPAHESLAGAPQPVEAVDAPDFVPEGVSGADVSPREPYQLDTSPPINSEGRPIQMYDTVNIHEMPEHRHQPSPTDVRKYPLWKPGPYSERSRVRAFGMVYEAVRDIPEDSIESPENADHLWRYVDAEELNA